MYEPSVNIIVAARYSLLRKLGKKQKWILGIPPQTVGEK